MLSNIRIVLIGTTHPGNIGAVARAMKNMCLEHLYLVRPRHYPSAEATDRASGAHDVLNQARVCESLDEALKGCRMVAGASARIRSVKWTQVTPRQCAETMLQEAAQGEVALIFGRESSGLSNAELDRCHLLVNVPANEEYSSLNLSQAVQVLAYELYAGYLTQDDPPLERQDVATAEEMEGLFQHLGQTMGDIGFSDPRQSDKLQRRLRRLFFRARPDKDEINILRGIFSAAQGRKSMRADKGESSPGSEPGDGD